MAILQHALTLCASLLISYGQKIPRQDFAQFVTDPSYENRKYHGIPILQTSNFEKDYQQSLISCARECYRFKDANRNCKAFNLFQRSSSTYVCELLGLNFCEKNPDKDLTIVDQEEGIIWERSTDSGDPCLGSGSSCQNKGRLGCTGSNCNDYCVQNCRDFDEFVEVTLWPSGESSHEIQARCYNNEICLLRLNLASNCVKDQSCAYVMELTALNTLITTFSNYKLQLTMVTVDGTKFEAFYNNFTLDMAQYFLNITFPNLGIINKSLSVTLPSLNLTVSLPYVKNFIEAEINKTPDLVCCGTKESEKRVKRDQKETKDDKDTEEGSKKKSKDDENTDEGSKKKSKDDENTDEGSKKKSKDDENTDEGSKKKSKDDENTDEGSKKKSKDDKDTEEGSKKKSKDDKNTDEGDKKKSKDDENTDEGDKKKSKDDKDTDEGSKKKSKDDENTDEGSKKKSKDDENTDEGSKKKSKDDKDTEEGSKKKSKDDKNTDEGDKKKSKDDKDTEEGSKKKSKDDENTDEGSKKKSKDDENTDEGDKKKSKDDKNTDEGDKKKSKDDENTDEGDKKKSKDDEDTEEGDKKKTENDKDTEECSQEKWFKLLEARKDLTSLTMVLI